MENSELLDRQARLGIEPDTFSLSVLRGKTYRLLVGRVKFGYCSKRLTSASNHNIRLFSGDTFLFHY